MIEFMVIAGPRSGTAWASAWLTTETTLCLHDPLWTIHYRELDAYQTKKRFGVACTGLWKFPDWVNGHPARKVIVHRPVLDISISLKGIGMPPADPQLNDALWRIRGMHISFEELFTRPKYIWEHLMGRSFPFDEERQRELRKLTIVRDLRQITVDKDVSRRLLGELVEAAGARAFGDAQ